MTSVVPVHGHFSNSDAAGKMNNLSGGGCEASEEGGRLCVDGGGDRAAPGPRENGGVGRHSSIAIARPRCASEPLTTPARPSSSGSEAL